MMWMYCLVLCWVCACVVVVARAADLCCVCCRCGYVLVLVFVCCDMHGVIVV